ncbi:hypothetical protein QU886_27105, partial [Klebsiella pneumoniae]|uniref:hypothetical protein n=1 Tax=Klebsiella pneumoniae TaxID=573 RepID=UPI0038B9D1EA
RHRQQFDQVAKFRSGRQKEINQVANSPGTGSSSTRWPSSDLDARRKSTRWPTHQAPAAAQPGGQLTRHRQQFDQVAKFRSGRQKEINQVANSPGTGSSSTR